MCNILPLGETAPDLRTQEKRRSSPYATQVCYNLLPLMGSLRFRRKPLSGKYCSFTCRGSSSCGE